MYVFVDDTDRTANVNKNSIQIQEELQQRTNSAVLTFRDVNFLDRYKDIKIYNGAPIVSLVGTTLTIRDDFSKTNLFRNGTEIWLGLGLATQEKVTVSSVSGTAITLSASAVSAHTAGELMGVLKFAGNIVTIEDSNIDVLKNLEWKVTAIDYTKIFDKKLINDSYEDVDARYIINAMCNDFINLNEVIDQMDYASDVAIQAEWIETGDGANPTVSSATPYESNMWGVLNWTFSAGTSTHTASPTARDLSAYTGASSGTPAKGAFGFWYKCLDYTKVTSFKVRIGSDSSNYIEWTITPVTNSAVYADLDLIDATITGTPVWTAVDYLAVIVTETADSSISFAGFRVMEDEHFRHYPYVQSSGTLDDFNANRLKPTEVMQKLADSVAYYWDIDYERNIRFFTESTTYAPFDLTQTSNNFNDLCIDYDTSKLVNRQVVKGGEEISATYYTEVKEGDGIVKEWILKSKFSGLIVLTDKNTSTDTCEAGTTTTNIKATGHGLSTGDYICNRTRSNAIRKITWVDADNFTVDTVASQTNGDTFSKFTAQTIGIEGLDTEAGKNFMYNYQEKSVRNTTAEAVINAGEFIQFKYYQVIPILVQRTDNTSVVAMKALIGYSDGVFDGQAIVDKTINTRAEAQATAQAVLTKFSNMVLTAEFTTNQEGLKAGQYIKITDTGVTNRSIDQYFLIQKIRQTQKADRLNVFKVTCSSLLYGIFEMLQQLFKQGRTIDVDADAIIENIEDYDETITLSDTSASAVDDNKQSETITLSDVAESNEKIPPFVFGEQLHSCDTYDGNGTWVGGTDAINVATDAVNMVEGKGCISFDVDVSAHANHYAILSNTSLTDVDLSAVDETGYFCFDLYIPDLTTYLLEEVVVRIGNDYSNYWRKTGITKNIFNAPFAVGWQKIAFAWADMAETGTVDPSAIDLITIALYHNASSGDATGVKIDNIHWTMGQKATDIVQTYDYNMISFS